MFNFDEYEEEALDQAKTLNISNCIKRGVQQAFIKEWSEGVILAGDTQAEPYFMEDCPNIRSNQVAAEEMYRLASIRKILWYPGSSRPPNLDVCPAHIVFGKRLRIVHDWTKAGLNRHLLQPPVDYGTMDSLVNLVSPGCHIAGMDVQDCFMHWPIHKQSRRRLGCRHPVTGQFGVFLFLPFGLGPAPGINDRNMSEIIRVAKLAVGGVDVTSFVDDLRLVNTRVMGRSPEDDRSELTFNVAEFKEVCESMGIRIHTKPGKLIWPTTCIEWIGWVLDSLNMIVVMSEAKVTKGLSLCHELLCILEKGDRPTAKLLMSFWGFCNFITQVIKQAQAHTRKIGRCIVVAKVFEALCSGNKRFNPTISLSPDAIRDILWWVELFQAKPHRNIHHIGGVSFLWHKKLPDLDKIRRLAWSEGLLVAVGLDASSSIGWGITIGDVYAQGEWSEKEAHLHINWKELKTYDLTLDMFPHLLVNRIVYVKSDNIAAIHYINCGRGRIDELSHLARTIRLKEVRLGIESVAVHLPGVLNVTPDALSRFVFDNSFRDKVPNRTIRKRLFKQLNQSIGPFTLDGMVADDGHNALIGNYCTPSDPFFEYPLQGHCVWLFPPAELVGPVLKFCVQQSKIVKNWSCAILLPDQDNAAWYKYLTSFRRRAVFQPGTDLFRNLVIGEFVALPKIKVSWLVVSLSA